MNRRQPLRLHDALGLATADKRLEILRRVGECGSISEAARQSGVSYKAAWQAIDTLGNLAGADLVVRTVGGSGGGGAALSEAGRELLDAASLLEQARREVLERLAAGTTSGNKPGSAGLAALGLKTSMRNHLPCTIGALRTEGAAVVVTLLAPDGLRIRSKITRESAQLLGLTRGLEVLALFKATAVEIYAAEAPPCAAEAPPDSRNRLTGQVTRISGSRSGGEVALRTEGGISVVGFSGPGSRLKRGAPAAALFDVSSVVIALAD